MTQAESTAGLQLLAFAIGEAHYAVPVGTVESVVPYGKLTNVPGTPGHVLGVLNLRGNVISIIDLRTLLGLTPTADPTRGRVIVIQTPSACAGILVDSVSEVFALDEEALVEMPAEIDLGITAYIDGVIRTESRLTMLLRPDALFT